MDDLRVEDIVKACGGKFLGGNLGDVVCGFSKDTRSIKPGEVFVGINGENFDGNAYYMNAFENGACACIIERSFEENVDIGAVDGKSIIVVEDGIKALQDIAKFRRNMYNIPVVAITGSVGKTSTKDIVASGLSKSFNVLKTEGNNNNHIGLPLTILRLKDQNAMVVEMGMNHLGEISVLTNIARPSVCVITNIGTSHIGNLGSRENILKAKLEILEGLQDGGIVIVNNDNDLLHSWAIQNKDKYNIVTYGIENDSDYMAYNIENTEENVSYDIDIARKTYKVNVPVSGIPFVYNSLSAIAVRSGL